MITGELFKRVFMVLNAKENKIALLQENCYFHGSKIIRNLYAYLLQCASMYLDATSAHLPTQSANLRVCMPVMVSIQHLCLACHRTASFP